jgi:site-specific DNA-cytosine methylase
VELDERAAITYQMNFPETIVFQTSIQSFVRSSSLRSILLSFTPCLLTKFFLSTPPHEQLKGIQDGSLTQAPQVGEVDLVAGGPPCQKFSVLNASARNRALKAEQSGAAMLIRAAQHYKPKYFLLENVVSFFIQLMDEEKRKKKKSWIGELRKVQIGGNIGPSVFAVVHIWRDD